MYFFCRLILCCLITSIYAQKDLEEIAQDFVLETKQIFITDHPYAFNPSIVKWNGRWLMSFRVIDEEEPDPVSSASASDIGLIFLDDDLNPIGEPQFIVLKHPDQKRPKLLAEDARLIVNNDRLFLIYSANKEAEIKDEGFRVYVAEVEEDQDAFSVVHNECLSDFEGMDVNRREKNWTPFIYENDLLLSYHLFPHRIFRPLLDGSEQCETVAESYPSLTWEWGELRGGTPALKLNEKYYLGIFHSSMYLKSTHSNDQLMPHYFMGAYLFSVNPPFELKFISPEPITGPNFYHGPIYEPYWHPVRVVFPCGLVINDQDVWIVYGRQDHEIWIARLDKGQLIESLIHISTLVN